MSGRTWTDDEVDFVARTYRTLTAAQQAAKLGRPVHGVHHKRSALLAAGKIDRTQRAYAPEWTDDERQTALELVHDGLSLRQVARRIKRPVESVQSHINRAGLRVRDVRDTRTVHQVAELFGVCADTILRVWIKRGWLKVHVEHMPAQERKRARRLTTIRRPKMRVTDLHLMAFLDSRESWPFWEPRMITDRDWRDSALACRAEAGGHWVGVKEIGRRYGYSDNMVLGWIHAGLLPGKQLGRSYFVWSVHLEGWSPPINSGIWSGRKKPKGAAA